MVVVLALWGVAAFAFASWRIPYDDEWFSIELARDTSWTQFWWALRHDVHPPWVALLDRLLWSDALGAAPHRALRVLAAALGIALVLRVLEQRAGAETRWAAFVAFHPVLFMYAGAMRYYPFLFAAQALRAWAIFAVPPGSMRARIGLVAGAALGCACFYPDYMFLAIDLVLLLRVWPARERPARLAAVALVAAIACLASPLWPQPMELVLQRGARAPNLLFGPVSWLSLGLAGEFHPSAVLAVLVVPAGWIAIRWLSRAPEPPLRVWLLATALAWVALALVATPQPRYSLLVWMVMTAAAFFAWSAGAKGRVWLGVSAGYLAIGFGLMLAGTNSVRADLNRMPLEMCAALRRLPGSELIVAPYPRTREQVVRLCRPEVPVESVPLGKLLPDRDRQLDGLRAHLETIRRITLITVDIKTSSLAATQRRVDALVNERCRELSIKRVARDAHGWIKALVHTGRPDKDWLVRELQCTPRR